MRIIILTILETLSKLDVLAKFICYKEIPKQTLLTSIIEKEKVIIVPPKFLNNL